MNQADLAQLAGTSRESVSRFLADLERAGVVRSGRGRVTVLEPAEAAQLHLLAFGRGFALESRKRPAGPRPLLLRRRRLRAQSTNDVRALARVPVALGPVPAAVSHSAHGLEAEVAVALGSFLVSFVVGPSTSKPSSFELLT